MSAKVERVCETCGKTFLVKPSCLKYGRGKNCSPGCQYASMRRQISVTCLQCAIVFEVKKSDYEYRVKIGEPPKYCSLKCAHKSPEWSANLSASLKANEAAQEIRRERAKNHPGFNLSGEIRSQNASAAWQKPETRQRIMEGIKRRSDSPEWRNAAHFQKGELHPRYKGNKDERLRAVGQYAYKAWRMAVFRRDDFTCQSCNRRGGTLNAHHIKPWSTHKDLRYEISNGQTLCVSCHATIPKPTG